MPNIVLAAGDGILTGDGVIRIASVAGGHVRVSVPQGVAVEREPQDLLTRFSAYHRRHPDVLVDLVTAVEADKRDRVQLNDIFHRVRAARVRRLGRSSDPMCESFIPLYALLIRLLRPDLSPRIGSRLQVDVDRLIELCGEQLRYETAEQTRKEIEAEFAAGIEQFVDSLVFEDDSN